MMKNVQHSISIDISAVKEISHQSPPTDMSLIRVSSRNNRVLISKVTHWYLLKLILS